MHNILNPTPNVGLHTYHETSARLTLFPELLRPAAIRFDSR